MRSLLRWGVALSTISMVYSTILSIKLLSGSTSNIRVSETSLYRSDLFGELFAGKLVDNTDVVLKVLSSNVDLPSHRLLKELSILQFLHARNQMYFLIPYGVVPKTNANRMGIVIERLVYGVKFSQFSRMSNLSSTEYIGVVQHIFEGLRVMWTNKIVHNDFHSDNILVARSDNKFFVKIIDFDRSWRAINVVDLSLGILLDLDSFCYTLVRTDDINFLFIAVLDGLDFSSVFPNDDDVMGSCVLCSTVTRILKDEKFPDSCQSGLVKVALLLQAKFCNGKMIDSCPMEEFPGKINHLFRILKGYRISSRSNLEYFFNAEISKIFSFSQFRRNVIFIMWKSYAHFSVMLESLHEICIVLVDSEPARKQYIDPIIARLSELEETRHMKSFIALLVEIELVDKQINDNFPGLLVTDTFYRIRNRILGTEEANKTRKMRSVIMKLRKTKDRRDNGILVQISNNNT